MNTMISHNLIAKKIQPISMPTNMHPLYSRRNNAHRNALLLQLVLEPRPIESTLMSSNSNTTMPIEKSYNSNNWIHTKSDHHFAWDGTIAECDVDIQARTRLLGQPIYIYIYIYIYIHICKIFKYNTKYSFVNNI